MCENTVGARNAQQLLQMGSMLSPHDAKEVGFIDEVLPDDECMARAHELMQQYVRVPREARANTKLIQRAEVNKKI